VLHTVKKIGPVLDLFTPERPEWRMTDMARALNMPKSSMHSLASTLAEVGLLSVSPRGGYRLGYNLLNLSERMRATMNFGRHALPTMQKLSQSLRETTLLAVLDRREVVYVERTEGTHPMVRLAGVRPGSRAPVQCTSVGKVLLAYLETSEVRSILSGVTWKQYTARTITDQEALERELVTVRARGIAYDRGELVPDIACVAAPITDRWGTVVAALSISMPAYRFPKDHSKLILPLKAATERISAEIARAEEPASPAEENVVTLAV
jgi:DNA-binding IclR family transcriptional regulator